MLPSPRVGRQKQVVVAKQFGEALLAESCGDDPDVMAKAPQLHGSLVPLSST